jgi:glycine/D-amino acid oxidase-like deaminating enzyme
MATAGSPRVLVLGSGVIGASSALHISRLLPSSHITILESTAVACAASGKAGGFLGRRWQEGSPTGPLSEKSWELHSEWAEELNGKEYGYRKVDTFGVEVGKRRSGTKSGKLPWLDSDKISSVRGMGKSLLSPRSDFSPWLISGRLICSKGTSQTTAQLHPFQFTHTVLAAAVKSGRVDLVFGTAAGLIFDSENRITGVRASKFSGSKEALEPCRERGYTPRVLEAEELIEADYVVICLGPWSGLVNAWLPSGVSMPKVDGLVRRSPVGC